MRLKKSFDLALNILFHSKLRSWLTIIGIIIGIGAVVSILSISQGAQKQLQSSLGNLGADILTVSPGVSRAQGFGGDFGGRGGGGSVTSSSDRKNLTSRDILALKSVDNVLYVAGEITGRQDLTFNSKTSSSNIRGEDISVWKDVTTETLAYGRFLNLGDSFSVVLGGNLVSSTFQGQIGLNNNVVINGKNFKVVGITSSGSNVYIPIDIARTTIDGKEGDMFDSISVKIKNIDLANDTVTAITNKLMMSRGILNDKKMDFSVSNPADRQATIQQTLGVMTLFLGAIAAISLLVGAIGIANTMFTSVLEKTKDIGIMKAIGAKNLDILAIFLFNSGLIGLVGGIGGIILGVIGSGVIGYYGSSIGGGQARLFGSTFISASLLIYSLVFSILIGMIAGAIPAIRASRLNPVDALRYE